MVIPGTPVLSRLQMISLGMPISSALTPPEGVSIYGSVPAAVQGPALTHALTPARTPALTPSRIPQAPGTASSSYLMPLICSASVLRMPGSHCRYLTCVACTLLVDLADVGPLGTCIACIQLNTNQV